MIVIWTLKNAKYNSKKKLGFITSGNKKPTFTKTALSFSNFPIKNNERSIDDSVLYKTKLKIIIKKH